MDREWARRCYALSKELESISSRAIDGAWLLRGRERGDLAADDFERWRSICVRLEENARLGWLIATRLKFNPPEPVGARS
jgi:hypothetical protein